MQTDKNLRDFNFFFIYCEFYTTGNTWRKRQIATGGDLTLSDGKFCGGELTVNRSARYKHNPHLRI